MNIRDWGEDEKPPSPSKKQPPSTMVNNTRGDRFPNSVRGWNPYGARSVLGWGVATVSLVNPVGGKYTDLLLHSD